MPITRVNGEFRSQVSLVRHHIQRIGYNDNDGVGRMFYIFRYGLYNAGIGYY